MKVFERIYQKVFNRNYVEAKLMFQVVHDLSWGASCDRHWQEEAVFRNTHFVAPSPSFTSMNASEIIDNSILCYENQLPDYKLQTPQHQFKQSPQACIEQLPLYQSSSKCSLDRAQGASQVPNFNSAFKEQIANVNIWFQELKPSEQIVLLVTLARQLNSAYLKMFSNLVDQLMTNAAQEILNLEAEANDIDVAQGLFHRPSADVGRRLLALLPLLHHDASPNLRRVYVDVIRQVRLNSYDTSRQDQWRQILAIALLHPAFSIEDRTLLQETSYNDYSHFNGHDLPGNDVKSRLVPCPAQHDAPPLRSDSGLGLDQVPSGGGIASSSSEVSSSTVSPVQQNPASSSQSEAFYPPQASAQPPSLSHQPLSRQLSLAPAVSTGHHPSSPNSSGFLSGSDSHAPLSPQSSASSSGEDALIGSRPATRNVFLDDCSGMRNVPSWLKSLRLHKYAKLFQHMTYDEMQNISEEWLEARNVTKGARNKILVSIRRLRERQEQVRRMEMDLGSGNCGAVRTCLLELRNIIATPIRQYCGPEVVSKSKVDDGDLPGQIIHCLWKAVSLMLVSRRHEEENCSILGQIVDAIFDNEAFTERQKNLCSKWRQEVDTLRGPTFRKYLWDHPSPGSNCANLKPVSNAKKPLTSQWSGPLKSNLSHCRLAGNSSYMMGFMEAPSPSPLAHPAFLPLPPQPSEHLPLTKHNSFGTSAASGVSPQRSQVERTHSAPGSGAIIGFYPTNVSHMSMPGAEHPAQRPSDCTTAAEEEEQIADINRSLDLLAKKVTEAAIGDSDLSGE